MSNQVPAWQGPILDNHFHLNRNGRYLDAAHDFKRAGGTNIVLIHCPDFASPPTTKEGHRDAYQNTIAMAESVRSELGLHVRVVLVLILRLLPTNSLHGLNKTAQRAKIGQ